MIEVGSYDAKARLPELLRRVEAGETVTVTRRGKPVARIVPIEADRRAENREAIDAILALRKGRPPITVEEILSARDEGRRF